MSEPAPSSSPAPLLCLAASGGGHLRQLLQMHSFWNAYQHFFVTEDTALGRSLAEREEVHFVPHFALGQVRLGHKQAMLAAAWQSLWRSLAIIREKRPQWVITTGAGSQIFVVLWARLLGARIVLIDSFVRFHAPSGFARVARYLAHHVIAQAEPVGAALRAEAVFDPIVESTTSAPAKEPLLLATVGATLPFPRLIDLVCEAKACGMIGGRVLVQSGDAEAASAPDVDTVTTLSQEAMQDVLRRARVVICHGGTGSMLGALEQHCHVIVIPRAAGGGEHYDDHQHEIAEAFAARGLVQVAHDAKSLGQCLAAIETRSPLAVRSDYGTLCDHLRRLIDAADSPQAR